MRRRLSALSRRPAVHHISIRPSPTTALVQLAEHLPPAILASRLGRPATPHCPAMAPLRRRPDRLPRSP
ncbi:hypothetical protein [Streptomyces sp. NPDC057939]|uniref:hypothetical protein n=1 Tax=Streptomyces sp. NPDC057939 TaxID=3346284 RepID=UPI0036EF79BB